MGQVGGSGGLGFEVLGPVRALRDGEELPLGSPQQQALLLSLLFRSGRQVSGGQLIDDLWGDEPPASAHGVIRTYVHRLRRVLGPDVLTSLGGGYLLVADHDGLDTARCETLAARARVLRADGRPAEAATVLRAALALWRGEPMSGVPGPYVRRRRREWEERRLAVLEARLEVEAEAGAARGTVGGRWTGSVAELTALVEEHPLRERLSELLMLALYRSGRQAEALEAYRAADRRLRTELGVAPGPGLRELHGRILAADRTLTAPAVREPAVREPAVLEPAVLELAVRELAPTPPGEADGSAGADPAALLVPDQLPSSVADFTGRAAEAEALRAALREPGCVPVVAVAGMGGVGKTALAVQVAHDLAGEFPDGRLHLDLHGTDGRPTRPEDALAVFLRSFGVVGGAIPTGLAERAARYRSLLSGRRVLVLLDNARDAEQVRPLLPGSPGCAVLVTGRTRIGALPNARFTELAVLSADEAVTLLTRVVGGERVAAEPEAARELVRLCGQLPLAVRILAARLACRPSWSIARLVEQLGGDRYRLDALRAGDLAVESSFRFGFDQLDAEQARAFRLLAVPEVPDLSPGEVAAVLDRPAAVAEELAESLVDCSMLEVAANPDRYRYHDLLRAFAQRLGRGDDAGAQTEAQAEAEAEAEAQAEAEAEAEAERLGVLTRLVDHHHARATADPGDPAAHGGDHLVVGGDYVAVGALVSQCAKLPRPAAGAAPALDRLAELLLGVCLSAASGRAARPLGHAANALLRSALEQGDRTAEARARLVLGRLLTEVGSASSALSELLRARDLCTAHGLPEPLLALAHGSLAACFVHLGRAEEAVAGFSAAVAVRERSGDRRALAAELLDLAGAFARQGRYDAAGRVIDQSLLVSHELADHALEARAREALGSIAHDLGRYDGAVSHRRAALALTDPADHRRTGRILLRLVESLRAAGRGPEAVGAAERAVEALTLDGDHRGRGLALAALGDALADGPVAGDSPGAGVSPSTADDPVSAEVRARARACWTEAHDILAPIGSPEAERLVPLLGRDRPAGPPRRRWPSWLPA
ncbi:NB-ARC domain-containing protein [Kitasatospora purpeofusca]|uniref:AfsR/SARP family transcriptional regulator n=1 Tax=Kitasatospora purpeofusca TaxID=67352 RepID=UPI0022523D8C|nr:BTAD domain-containing putative transcriptional regulator [Kitasatospora purpeofusca]MCX4684783.1 NB-ARC domain-containing protein [Kitasatospora purpeofusca]